jgi:hypothetical protein
MRTEIRPRPLIGAGNPPPAGRSGPMIAPILKSRTDWVVFKPVTSR